MTVGVRLIAACLCAVAMGADAATPADDRYQSALDAMLADIGNPQKSFEFVQAATDVGDLRGAVAALDRMLLVNPALANIELELGVLYFRLGNPDLGRYYVERALKAPNVPRVVRQRAEAMLAASGAQSGHNFLHGAIALTGHYDNNANAAPASPDVLVLGQPGQLADQNLKHSDVSGDLAVSLSDIYAFAGGRGHALETNFLLYGSKFDKYSQLDLAIASLDVGPALRIAGSDNAPIVLRPYVSGSYDLLDGNHYLNDYGGGLELRAQANVQTYTFVRLDFSREEFYDSSKLFVSDRTGNYFSGAAGITHQFGPLVQLSLTLLGDRAHADTDYQSFKRWGGDVGARFFFGYGRALPPWTIAVSMQARKAEYDAADPAITSAIERSDRRYDANVSLEVPVARSLVVALRGRYTRNESNLPNYDFNSAGGSLGVTWRF